MKNTVDKNIFLELVIKKIIGKLQLKHRSIWGGNKAHTSTLLKNLCGA